MELRAERGRAVLVGAPELFRPSTALACALDEWAEVAAAVCANRDTDPATSELVSARGRQLAARLAAAAGTPVRYTDPIHGVLEQVPAAGTLANATPATRATEVTQSQATAHAAATTATGDEQSAGATVTGGATHAATATGIAQTINIAGIALAPGAAAAGGARHTADTSGDAFAPGAVAAGGARHTAGTSGDAGAMWAAGAGHAGGTVHRGDAWAAGAGAARPGTGSGPADGEPTPWATGLALSAIAGVVVLMAVVTLVRGLGGVSWWFGLVGLVVVTAGLAPSVWLARTVPVWRWVSYGVAAGLATSWLALVLASLGP